MWYVPQLTANAAAETPRYSGALEAEQIAIVPEIAGRITDIRVQEGDTVNAGDILVQLDTALLDTQIQQGQAAVATANANLAQLLAGARPEEIAAAEGALAQALAARDGAQKALDDAQAIRANPQPLITQITDARGRVAQAEAQIKQAQTNVEFARFDRDRFADGSVEYQIADGKYRAALAQLDAANTARDGAQKALADLLAMKTKPIALDAQVNAAQAQFEQTVAQVTQAQAALDALKQGATAEQIAMARANVKQAETALNLLQIQRAKLTLRSPISGRVVKRTANLGETASAGATLLTVANLDSMKLTVYVPETQLSRVSLDQRVRVQMDAYPRREFDGRVVFISPRAEFTPKNVQTASERATTVFTVKIALENADRALTMGMTGEARLGE